MAAEKLHILDGYGYIYRAHYGLAAGGRGGAGVRLTTVDGMPTSALYVYASMLIRLHLDVRPERIVVVYDAPGRTFRDDISADYKATRSETPEDLIEQMPHFRPLTESFCWPVVSVPGVEADDVIATLVDKARARDWDVVVYSGDKDLMQLVGDNVLMVDAMRQKTYDAAAVEDKFGVPPALVSEWLAMVGDKIDNIPGMPGVGKVTATKLLRQFGSIDGILANTDQLKGKMQERFRDPGMLEKLQLSRDLARLKTDVELDSDLDVYVPSEWDSDRISALFHKFEFEALLDRLGEAAPAKVELPIEVWPEPVLADDAAVAELAAAAKEQGALALAVEGDGRRVDRQQLVGVALAVSGRAPLYVPVHHHYLGAPAPVPLSAHTKLAAVLADPDVAVYCHNSKQAHRLIVGAGCELRGVASDTMLASYLLDSESESTGIERVARKAIGIELDGRQTVTGKGKKAVSFESVPVEVATGYLGKVAAAVHSMTPVLADRLERSSMTPLYNDVELPLAELLARIERVGVRIDQGYLRGLADEVGGRVAAIESEVHELAGEQFNLGSPKQLSVLLFDKLGLRSDRMKRTKTGYSTDHEVLESMATMHPIVPLILEHRELVKLRGTYIDALPPLANPDSGRLHTTFRQAVASTGRLSSQDPNLQNIPIRSELGKKIRRAFIAKEGTVLLSADYSQIELRVMAHLSGDPVLSRAFRDRVDVHTQTAAEVFDIQLAEVGAHERRVAKAVNYGLIYGQSDFGLSRALDIPVGEAKRYIERYFERFSRVRTFMDEVVTRARKAGYAETLLGRRRPIPDLSAKNFRLRSAAERVAQNTPMQGSAADIMKLAMLRVDDFLATGDYDATMLLTVHDELVFEVAPLQAKDFGGEVATIMENVLQLDVPLEVDVGIGPSWAEAH